MQYPLRYRVCLGLVLTHLFLMILGASDIGYSWSGPLAPALDYYGSLSGADTVYDFFAPGIDGQLRAIFKITDHFGKSREVNLAESENQEADLRVGNIIDEFQNHEDDPISFQRALSSSLAGTIFGRYPEAEKVTVKLENYIPVSMKEYRSGMRPHWDHVYEAQFAITPSGSK